MTSILTNNSATIALQTLRTINAGLDQTSNRVSTGQRISSAADGAAYWAIASTLKSDNGSLSALKDAMSLDKNSVDAASAGLNKVIDQLTTIKNALTSAASGNSDKAKLQNDITVALNAIKTYSDNTVMNGSNWLSVKSDATGFASSKDLVAAYSRAGGTVSVSKTALDTSGFILYDSKAAASTGGKGASSTALANIAIASSTAAAAVSVKTGATVQGGFMDTAYTVTSIVTPRASAAYTGSTVMDNAGTAAQITGATLLSGATAGTALGAGGQFANGDTLVVNGTTITFKTSGATGNDLNITDSVTTLLAKIDSISGATGSTVTAGKLVINTGLTSDLTIGGSAVAKLGLTPGTTARGNGTSVLTANDVSLAKLDITASTVDQLQISAYLKIVDATTQQLLTGASVLGSMSTLLKSQQDFTQQLIDINTSSIGSLVDANIEEESTKLKALQTQQQLGVQALSIANSSSQNVLSLFR